MWRADGNPLSPLFQKQKAAAANVPHPGECGNYTVSMFQTDFPQFFENETESSFLGSPDMLRVFITQANDSVLPSRWGSMWRYAAGLYTAHFSTMYLKTYAPGASSRNQVVQGAAQAGVVKSATMGDTSISYDNSAVTAGTEKWGTWNATQYGQQLVTLARLVGIGGMYVI
ncbi:MAG: DUF4054 domain-containing protein [Lachnospiraceae bacterium]|jgi:hypothetical protein|nr:DUF4054 domain-containing protein [Lachnospiraceae bacterium]MCI9592248.1 DUF4054 domain-containing protein [Lachnospiraceae bacterium]